MQHVRKLAVLVALTLFTVVAACSSGSSSGSTPDTVGPGGDTQEDVTIPSADGVAGDSFIKPDGGSCDPGARRCEDDTHTAVCTEDGSGWVVQECGESSACIDGACVEVFCVPYERQCLESNDGWTACNGEGSGWVGATMCAEDETCLDGVCLEPTCDPGLVVCAQNAVLVCAEDGVSWETTECPEETICFAGSCVECVNADQCAAGEACFEGVCAGEPPVIVKVNPPDGVVSEAYSHTFEAAGGLPPYNWTLASGALPPGLSLSASGRLTGTPTQAGEFGFELEVEDQNGLNDSAAFTMMVNEFAEGVRIVTASPLPSGEDGFPYQTTIEARGGTPPYAWMLAQGVLPAGLNMDWQGNITGTPNMDIGDFLFTVRVFDNSTPPTWDEREFMLRIEIAPLEIIGDQEIDLMVTKVITLPLLTFIEGVPLIRYDTQLQARGGLRPYHWSEIELPQFLNLIIPKSGIPEGLTLHEDGRLEGNVSSTEEVITVAIPFSQFELKGFFFVAQVADSQDPAESEWALFLIPTVPIETGL